MQKKGNPNIDFENPKLNIAHSRNRTELYPISILLDYHNGEKTYDLVIAVSKSTSDTQYHYAKRA